MDKLKTTKNDKFGVIFGPTLLWTGSLQPKGCKQMWWHNFSSHHSEYGETELVPPAVCRLTELLDARWQRRFESLKRKHEIKEEDDRVESSRVEELNPGPRNEHESDILVIREEGDFDEEEKLCNPGSSCNHSFPSVEFTFHVSLV